MQYSLPITSLPTRGWIWVTLQRNSAQRPQHRASLHLVTSSFNSTHGVRLIVGPNRLTSKEGHPSDPCHKVLYLSAAHVCIKQLHSRDGQLRSSKARVGITNWSGHRSRKNPVSSTPPGQCYKLECWADRVLPARTLGLIKRLSWHLRSHLHTVWVIL